MKHFKFLILFLLSFFFLACSQESNQQTKTAKNPFENKKLTPLEELTNKVKNTVIIEPLRSLEDNHYFYNMKQTLSRALENSTQKELFYSCDEFKKLLRTTLQTDYSSDFPAGSWQRNEVEELAQILAKEQCAEIYTLRANFLADLQSSVNISDTKEDFLQNTEPIIENYAKEILAKSDFYIEILNNALIPYKKLRQVFYPLEQAGYSTYLFEQNDFKTMKKIVLPYMKGNKQQLDENKIKDLLNKAQEEEKVLFVFLKQYETLTQINGDCINKFFRGLQNKWYDFMYEIEKLPANERQAYAEKRFKQAKDGLQNKCPDLYKKNKQTQQEQTQQQTLNNQPEPEENTDNEEENYDF